MSLDQRPEVGPFTLPAFPQPIEHQVGALNAQLFTQPGSTMASVALILPRAGYLNEPATQRGVYDLMLKIACEAGGGLTSEEFQLKLDALGAQISSGVGPSASAIWLRLPGIHLQAGMGLLADVARRATLAADVFRRWQRFTIEDLQMGKEMPDQAAALVLDEYYFDDSDAHARLRFPSAGVAKDLERLRLADVEKAYQHCLQPLGATLVIAGDFDVDAIARAADEQFADWTSTDDVAPAVHPRNPTPACTLVLVPRPGAVQSCIALAMPAIGHLDADYARVLTKAHVVVTGAEARLNDRMRTEGGYTYGCRGSIDARADDGRLVVSTAVEADATRLAVADIADVLLNAAPLTEADAHDAVSELIASCAGDTATAQALAQQAVGAIAKGLGTTYRDDLVASLRQLDATSIDAAWTQHVRTDQTVMVVVGEQSVLRELEENVPFECRVVSVQDEFNEGMENDMSNVPYLNGVEEFKAAINDEMPVLVDFTASWCGPCKSLAPILDDLAANEWADQLRVVKVDADANPDICEEYGVMGLPTLMLFEEGEKLMASTGAMNKAQLIKAFDPFV